jgi:alkylated DNA repair dioxygenase AlkB
MHTNVDLPSNPFKMTTLFEAGMAKTDASKLVKGKLDDEGMKLLDAFVNEILAHQETEIEPQFRMGPKICTMHRNVLLLADPEDTVGYFYSGTVAPSVKPGPAAIAFQKYVNEKMKVVSNGMLINIYDDGTKYISPHSDNEKNLDTDMGVIIFSAGVTRKMKFRKAKKAPPGVPELDYRNGDVDLEHGSVVHMSGPGFQRSFTHELPPMKAVKERRISITLRNHQYGDETRFEAAMKRKHDMAEQSAPKRAKSE